MKGSSARPDRPRRAPRKALLSHLGALVALGVVAVACLIPLPEDVGSLPALFEDWPLDKVVHGAAFLVLPLFLYRSARELPVRQPLLWTAVGALAYGLVLELLQRLLQYRSGEVADAVADGIGVLVFVGWVWIRGSGRSEARS